MTALETVRREMWESYQAHLGEGCIDRRLLLRWYGMLDGSALAPVKDADEQDGNALSASDEGAECGRGVLPAGQGRCGSS